MTKSKMKASMDAAKLEHANRLEALRGMIKELDEIVQERGKIENPHWGHVGDLGHLEEQLNDALEAFTYGEDED